MVFFVRFLGYASWRHATTLIFETAPWARARVSLGDFFFIFQGQVIASNICIVKGRSISSNAYSREFLEFAILRPTGLLSHGDLFDPRFTRPSTSRLLFSEGKACAPPRLSLPFVIFSCLFRTQRHRRSSARGCSSVFISPSRRRARHFSVLIRSIRSSKLDLLFTCSEAQKSPENCNLEV